MTIRFNLLGLFALLALAAAPASAQCQLSATSVDFGSYDVFDASPLASTGSVTWFCGPPNQPVTIQLGAGGSGTFFPRQMAHGAERLEYNLYLDPAATQLWGDGSIGTVVFTGHSPPSGPSAGRTSTIVIHGRIPPGQNATFGIYSDTVTVTLLF